MFGIIEVFKNYYYIYIGKRNLLKENCFVEILRKEWGDGVLEVGKNS